MGMKIQTGSRGIVVNVAGTEPVNNRWSDAARRASLAAREATMTARKRPSIPTHSDAADAHEFAATVHRESGDPAIAQTHDRQAAEHRLAESEHRARAFDAEGFNARYHASLKKLGLPIRSQDH